MNALSLSVKNHSARYNTLDLLWVTILGSNALLVAVSLITRMRVRVTMVLITITMLTMSIYYCTYDTPQNVNIVIPLLASCHLQVQNVTLVFVSGPFK